MATTPKTQAELLGDKIAALETRLTSCTADECTRLDAALAALKTQEAQLNAATERFGKMEELIAAKAKEAIDARLDPLMAEIQKLGTVHATPVPAANPVPEIPKDAYFTCADCETPLLIGKDHCPNEKCNAKVDWGETFAPYLDVVEEK